MTTLKNHFKEYGNLYFFSIMIIAMLSFMVWFLFISDIFKNFLLGLEHFIQTKPQYVYLIAFLAAVAEGTIILGMIPGTTYIITMGVFLARGDVDAFVIFPVVIIGAFLGDLLGYAIGSFSSKFVVKNYGENTEYKMARKFIEKHGGKAVFLARFISGMKELVPFLTGILQMPLKKFMPWNFAGAIGWSITWISVGFFAGSFIKDVESIVKAVGSAFLVFFIISAYVFYQKNKATLLAEDSEK